jgi:hypothetical protein
MPKQKVCKEDESISREKNIQEIKWLKTQRNIAIFGLIASILATSIQYSTAIYKHISKASLVISLEDSYLLKKSVIKISSIGNNPETHIVAHPKEISDGIKLEAGSYSVKVELKGSTIFEDTIYLKPRKKRICTIPKFYEGTILIFPKINAHKVYPEMILPIIIDSSKEGYLWIYEIKFEGPPQILFPIGNVDNNINSGKEFILPEKGKGVIIAGKQVGKEKLLFIVTKRMDKAFADKIALTITKSVSQKASTVLDENSYGLATLSYEIEL